MDPNRMSINTAAFLKTRRADAWQCLVSIVASSVIAWCVAALAFLTQRTISEPPLGPLTLSTLVFCAVQRAFVHHNDRRFALSISLIGMSLGWVLAPVYAERNVSRLSYLSSLNRNNFGAVNSKVLGAVTIGLLVLMITYFCVPTLDSRAENGADASRDR